ncbi:hypothetical protein [Streptomyces mirabilis]|uniref:hypothetical protein n=1 Tax=Streptomyces mirabilis TaxID=68239 RepID=UPI0033310FF0
MGLLIGGAIAEVLVPTGAGAAFLALTWTAFTLRVIRLDPACLSPGGGSGPGGAGVSEPRRPKPALPTGTMALSLPDDPAADAASA